MVEASQSTLRRGRRRSGRFWTPSSSSDRLSGKHCPTERETEIGRDGKELGRGIDRNRCERGRGTHSWQESIRKRERGALSSQATSSSSARSRRPPPVSVLLRRLPPSSAGFWASPPLVQPSPSRTTRKFKDIWCHIHSLLTLRDAARTACVSHAFLRSWRCYPNLIFDYETLGLLWEDMEFSSRVDHILKKHSGIGVKTFKLDFSSYYMPKAFKYLDRWLQIVVTPGIEKLTLVMPKKEAGCNFPCPVLSDGNGSFIRYLHLVHCAFRPTFRLGCLRSLTVLHLDCVQITGDELGCLLSSMVALEQLKLRRCSEITCLEIPVQLQQLSYLQVLECERLRMLKIEAPNICSFHFTTCVQVEISLGESLRLKNLDMLSCRLLCYAREELPFVVPNLETLCIRSLREVANTRMAFVPSKFLHLKYLSICITEAYDYFSLVSFLVAAPSLETFILSVRIRPQCIDELLCEDPPHLRQMPGCQHDKLQRVKISRFYSSKSLVELTSHILENSSSMECLTLDTTDGVLRCSDDRPAKCFCLGRPMEAHKAVLVIGKYIEGKVPSRVKLNVVEPCSRCHAC